MKALENAEQQEEPEMLEPPVAPREEALPLPEVSAAPRAEDVPVPEEETDDEPNPDDEWDEQLRGLPITAAERQQDALDDVPVQLKRRIDQDEGNLIEEIPEGGRPAKRPRVSEGLLNQVMLSTLVTEDGDQKANERVSRYELALLQEPTGLPLTAARLHRQPRKKLARPPKMISRARLSILLGKDPGDTYVVEEDEAEMKANPRRRAAFPWKGITMYWKEKPKNKPDKVKSYVEKDGEIYEVKWSSRQRKLFEREWAAEMKDILMSEVMLLKMKQSGKELDPKFFDKEEKAQFDLSDQKEWSQWIENGVIRRLTPAERAKVPKEAIFKSPMRMVRTNKQQGLLLP